MDIRDKYKLDHITVFKVNKLPSIPTEFLYSLKINDKESKLFVNENGVLKLVATNPYLFATLLKFLKKYRKNPELLPKNLKNEFEDYLSSQTIYKVLQLMLTPVNNYEEFKATVDKGTKEIMPLVLSDAWGYGSEDYCKMLKTSKYGEELIFLNSKDEMGIKQTNMNGDVLEEVPDCRHLCIYHNKKDKQYEIWQYQYDSDSRGPADYYYIDAIFYEEKYLYEYLLNYTLEAVVP